ISPCSFVSSVVEVLAIQIFLDYSLFLRYHKNWRLKRNRFSVDTCLEFGVSLEASRQKLEADLLRCCDVAMLRSCCGLVADFLSVFTNKDGPCSDVAELSGG